MNSRIRYVVASLICIALGLFSRSSFYDFPDWSDAYVGDVLWASMVYFLIAVLYPKGRGSLKITLAMLFAFLIEFSQLIQTDWMNQIRSIPGMALVLGYGFKWSDLLCYTLGVGVAAVIDRYVVKH